MLTHLLALALVAAPARQDSVRVSATLSDDSIVVGEAVELAVSVETNGPRPRSIVLDPLPAGFDIIRRETGTTVAGSFTGGQRVITTQSWLIRGRVPGSYTMPAVRVVMDQRTYRTDPMPIAVLDAPVRPAEQSTVDRVRLVGRLEPERVYVGQQVTFVAEAVFPRSLRQRQTRPATYQAPNPSGFWAQDLPDPIVIGLRSIDGELYDTQAFRRAYFPLLAGEQKFPPATLAFEYRVSLGLPSDARELLSDTLQIDVLPIPEEGRPASFNGAVGRLSMTTTIGSERLQVGEATTLVVEVKGKGNVKALPAPSFEAPDGIEVFSPTESAEVETSSMELGGTKRFEWVVVPGEPGRLVIPPIEYAAFDPVDERFDVFRSDSIVLRVTGRRADGVPGIDLRPIRGRPSDGPPGWILSPRFALAQAVPLLLLFGAWWSVRERGVSTLRRAREERARRFHALRQEALAPDRDFWGRLAAAVRASVAEALDTPTAATAAVDTLLHGMQSAGVPRATATALADILRSLDRIRYAPGEITPADAPAMVDRAEQLLVAMAASLARTSRRTGTTSAALVALLLAPTLLAGQETPFARGVAAYRAADYETASAAFLEHTAAHPDDADGWYDAGNALFRAGETGRAVAAWVRAARLRPRHTDARQNIRTVSPAALAYVPPAASLTIPETLLALAGLWWITALLGALRIRSRQRAGRIFIAGAALALLIAIGGFAGLGQRSAAISLGDATVRVDPALKGEPLERVPAGVPVEVMDRRDDWLLVRTQAGIEGWVDLDLVEPI